MSFAGSCSKLGNRILFAHPFIWGVEILLACGKDLHDSISSLKNMFGPKRIFNQAIFIEMHVSSEREQSYTYIQMYVC